ncbi:MAG: RodZ domain-containing protein [Halodesulfovibrio sp.]
MTSMTELGALLQKERELRGLSREDVSRTIKVAIRTLKALESGELEELPHLVYTKGFVKSYARIVGLNPEELGLAVDAIYLEAYGEPEDPEPVYTPRNVQSSSSGWVWIVLIVLLIGLAAGGGWYFFLRAPSAPAVVSGENLPADSAVQPAPETPPAVQEQAPVPPVPPVPQDAPAGASNLSSDSSTGASIEAPAEGSAEAAAGTDVAAGQNLSDAQAALSAEAAPQAEQDQAELEAPAAGQETVAVVEPPAEEETTDVPAVTEQAATPSQEAEHVSVVTSGSASQDVMLKKVSGEQKITLSASAECWVEAWGDGVDRKEMYLRSGQKFVIRFPKTLTLRLGNSGGVSLALNGKNVKLDGADGKVLTMNFVHSR